MWNELTLLNSLTPVSDQDWISPHKINSRSSRKVTRIKQKQILWTNIVRIKWKTMRRITNKIWQLKVFKGVRTNLREWHKSSILNCRLLIRYLDSLYTLFSVVFTQDLKQWVWKSLIEILLVVIWTESVQRHFWKRRKLAYLEF